MRNIPEAGRWLLFLLLFCMLTQPLFFEIYRGAAFNIVPHDDYVTYVLKLLGEEGGRIPGSPFRYRLLAVGLAVPLFHVLPLYRFSNLDDSLSDTYLKALEAFSMVSYLAVVGTAVIMFLLCRRQYRATVSVSIAATFLSVLLFQHAALYGVDQITIFTIALLVYFLPRPWIFAMLMLLAVGVNEKIIIIFAGYFGARVLFRLQGVDLRAVATGVALCLYLAIVTLFPAPGNEHQLQVSTYFASFVENLAMTLSVKGMLLNVLPTLLVVVLYLLAVQEYRQRPSSEGFHPVDAAPLVGLVGMAMAVNVEYNIGRLAVHCFPFYLPMAMQQIAALVEGRLGSGGPGQNTGQG